MKSFNMKSHSKFLITAIMAACICIFLAVTALGAAIENNEITSIVLNKSKTDLTVEVRLTKEYVKENKSQMLGIFEFLPYQSTSSINTLEPIKTFKVDEKISVKVPYVTKNMNRLHSKFVIAAEQPDGSYSIITTARYIDNADSLADNTEPYPTTSSKKGLQIQLFEDAQLLGVQHTIINIPINEYMLRESSDASMSFLYNGQTFYLDKAKIARLDHRVKTYTEAGINVYFNMILTAPTETSIPSLYCENVSDDAALYALNTKNEVSMKSFQAFMDYMCARYTRADHEYGFVPNIILGFEVNSNRTWNNAGPSEMSNAVYSYCTAFRVAYISMVSHYSEGRVYISIGNNFNAPSSTPDAEGDPLYDYPAKEFLDFFNTAIQNSGNIPWGVSINPYASDTQLTDFWNDSYAKDDFNTPFITMKNIGVLTDYLAQDEFLCDGDRRSVIIGEFGISGDPIDMTSMTMQAAAYALAYYSAAQNDDIDAFIYHRHVDHSGENRYYGLWSCENGTVVEPANKKTIYNVFSLIDTNQSEEATSFVKQTVGSGAWGLFMDDKVKYKEFVERTVLPSLSVPASEFEKGYSDKVLFDLTDGNLCDFYPSDSVEYVELRPLGDTSKTMLYAKLSGAPDSYMGISNSLNVEDALTDAHYITLRVMVKAPADASAMNLMLRLQKEGDADDNTVVFTGETPIMINQWQDVSFRIKDFTSLTNGDADIMKLWVRTADGQSSDGEYGIWLESITVHTKGGLSVIGWILVILLVLILLSVAAYGALYLRAQYIRAKRRRLRQEAEYRRQEMLRAQAMQQTRGMNPPPYSRNQQNGQPPYNQNQRNGY